MIWRFLMIAFIGCFLHQEVALVKLDGRYDDDFVLPTFDLDFLKEPSPPLVIEPKYEIPKDSVLKDNYTSPNFDLEFLSTPLFPAIPRPIYKIPPSSGLKDDFKPVLFNLDLLLEDLPAGFITEPEDETGCIMLEDVHPFRMPYNPDLFDLFPFSVQFY